jgi:HEAT repeat protein
MRRFRLLVGLFVALLILPVASASAARRSEDSESFERMLRSIDIVPRRQSLKKRWPDIVERLIRASRDAKRKGYTRSRAISLLSFFPEARVRTILKRLLRDGSGDVRRIAIYTLARTFGDPGSAKLVDRVAHAIRDKEASVRTFALRSLRWIRHQRAVELLREVAETHKDRGLRRLATTTLKRRKF